MKVSRLGVVGLGGMGSGHAAFWRDLGVEVHGYDEFAEARAAAARAGVQVHDDLTSLLSAVDAVDVCTPTDVHARVALAAVRAGRHVIVEKPITRTLAEADELLAAASEANVQLHVAHVVRYFPAYAAAHEAVEAGRIGRPAVLRFTREGGLPGGRRWFLNAERSGGLILDVMIHDIDYARWIAGEVVRVYAKELRRVGPENTASHAYAVLTHADGAISHVTASWAREGAGFRTSFDIAGETGLLEYATDERVAMRTAPPELFGGGEWRKGEDPWSLELREFLTALNGGPAPRVSAADGRAALRIALAAIESAATGEPIEIDERVGAPGEGKVIGA